MLRIFLWKIGFEWVQLKRILWPRTERKVYYFAFGANLCAEVLALRRIRVYEAFDHVLEGAALRFSQTGFYKDHGYASADVTEGEVVYGKMYLVLESDAARLDYFEAVPFLRAHEKVCRRVDGLDFFHYQARKPREGLRPTQTYLDYLTTAYRRMPDVPELYVETLAATEVLDQLLPQDQTGEFVRDITRWPEFIRPTLVWYEACCLSLTEFLWNRSLFQWMIKT